MFKILVCDDDAGLRLSVVAALAATGRFEVDEAFDGVNALEKIKACLKQRRTSFINSRMRQVVSLTCPGYTPVTPMQNSLSIR